MSYVKGPLAVTEEDAIVVEAGHVGPAIHVPVFLLPELPRMRRGMTVYIYFQVREDAMTLYGFLHNQNRNILRQLPGVSGIGPEGTLGILSAFQPDDLRLATVSKDMKALARAPGIGSKTARRPTLNLRDRISMDNVPGSMAGGAGMGAVDTSASVAGLVRATREAVQALVTLDYTNTGASRAVKQVEVMDGVTSEDVLKASLKHLSFLQGF